MSSYDLALKLCVTQRYLTSSHSTLQGPYQHSKRALCTRSFKSLRHRGRYYCFCSRWDSYPVDLGKRFQSEILTRREAYVIWLAEQRARCEIIHGQIENYLIARPYGTEEEPREDSHSTGRPALDSRNNINIPGYMPEDLRDHDALWDYVVDLDREVFTVNSSAHIKLYAIPKLR